MLTISATVVLPLPGGKIFREKAKEMKISLAELGTAAEKEGSYDRVLDSYLLGSFFLLSNISSGSASIDMKRSGCSVSSTLTGNPGEI